MTNVKLQAHEYANLFPMMTDAEITALVDDMKRNGYDQTAPIVAIHGKILDGRNRYKAAQLAGVEPDFIEYDGNDPLEFVLRHNLHRRHLNETQRAGIAAKLANMPQGSRTDKHSANLPNVVSQKQAAEKLNVGERTLRTFKAVAEGMPELVPLMESGEMSAHEAGKQLKTEKRKKDIGRQRKVSDISR
jgi:hypothetical protein